MSILTKKLPSFTGVAPGQTASCRIPSNYSYHTFYIVTENIPDAGQLISARFGWWRTGLLFSASAARNVKKSWHSTKTIQLAVFVINAIRPKLKNRASVESTIIPFGANNDPNPITTLLIEFDIGAGVQRRRETNRLRIGESTP